jgi:hypothetical protein
MPGMTSDLNPRRLGRDQPRQHEVFQVELIHHLLADHGLGDVAKQPGVDRRFAGPLIGRIHGLEDVAAVFHQALEGLGDGEFVQVELLRLDRFADVVAKLLHSVAAIAHCRAPLLLPFPRSNCLRHVTSSFDRLFAELKPPPPRAS